MRRAALEHATAPLSDDDARTLVRAYPLRVRRLAEEVLLGQWASRLAAGDAAEDTVVPLLAERPQQDGKGTAYVCRRFVCDAPVTDPEELASRL